MFHYKYPLFCIEWIDSLGVSSNGYTGSREWVKLQEERMAEHHISLLNAFASGDANEWFKHFDICCMANRWNETTSELTLPNLLEGEALTIRLELSEEQQRHYAEVKK